MITDAHLAAIRTDYILAALDEATAGNDPILFFSQWFAEAQRAEITEVNAMTLATADAAGQPHARIVLLKGLDDQGFTFFTNYDSAKGEELTTNPCAALVFFWKELERQVRIEGKVTRLASADSDTYFNSRPRGSRIGAWASPQSSVIPSRELLEARAKNLEIDFKDKEITRPPHWGGYCLVPHSIEFWQGRRNRLHDRICFRKDQDGSWTRVRLAP